MTTNNEQSRHKLLWTLEDYLQFLDHPSLFVQKWAHRRLGSQYPDVAKTASAVLHEAEAIRLRIAAYEALAEVGGEENEEKLLSAYGKIESHNEKIWAARALGEMESERFWPEVENRLSNLNLNQPQAYSDELAYIALAGSYSKSEAGDLLWRMISQYDYYDHFMRELFDAVLNHIQPDTVPRLIERAAMLKPLEDKNALRAIPGSIGLASLTVDVGNAMKYDKSADFLYGIKEVEGWMGQKICFSEAFTEAIKGLPKQLDLHGLSFLLTICLNEFEGVAAKRGDIIALWLDEWNDMAQGPADYRKRTLVAYQTLRSLNEHRWQEYHINDIQTLLVVLLGNYLIDDDTENRLVRTTTVDEEYSLLMQILASKQELVLPNLIDRLAAFGPASVPSLIEILKKQEDEFWPLQRSLALIEKIARAHPGSCDQAVDPILQLFIAVDDPSDFTCEAAQNALIAIGPAVPDRAAPHFTDENYAYSIYVGSALGDIPTLASQEALTAFYEKRGNMEELDWVALESLGQPESIEFMAQFAKGFERHIAISKYTIALLNDMEGSEVDKWGRVAIAEQMRMEKLMTSPDTFETVMQLTKEIQSEILGTPTETGSVSEPVRRTKERVPKARLKKKRKSIVSSTKARQKPKKKRKRKK